MTLFEKVGAAGSALTVAIMISMAADVASPVEAVTSPIEHFTEQFECLAQNIYFESRSESQLAQRAVGYVTLNRVKSDLYPNSICEVVKQGAQKSDGSMVKDKCHFSWYCDGKPDTITEQDAWIEAQRVAYMVINNYDQFPDPVEGALMFHAAYVSPLWRYDYKRVTRIDKHIFYKLDK